MRRLFATRRRKVAVAAVLALLVAAAAWAAWLVISTGTSSGKAGSLVAPTVTANDSGLAGDLFPGTTGTLQMQVDNPNGALVVEAVQQNGTVTSGTPGT